MTHRTTLIHLVFLLVSFSNSIATNAQTASSTASTSHVTIDDNGTLHIPAYELPLSSYMSEEAKRAYIGLSRIHFPTLGPKESITKYRELADTLLLVPELEKAKAAYAVHIEEERIANVRTEIVTPAAGIPNKNQNRVLINLHGGAFLVGAGSLQLIESIPIAATAKMKVISIDYRLGPEYKFPAASEDVAAVYRELLRSYKAQNVGIYGHASGGALTAMSIAWFQKEKLPIPGAIGLFSPAYVISGGDSRFMAAPLDPMFGFKDKLPPPASPNPPAPPVLEDYFAGTPYQDPLVSPIIHPDVLAGFPPTLLVTSTRDADESAVVQTHRELVKAGVEAELHVWDGVWHGFIQEVDLPESQEMYAVTAKFFNEHLGRSR
jgi:epsilon-lactone hydrolase